MFRPYCNSRSLDDGTLGIGNAALAPQATKVVIDTYLKPLLIGQDPMNSEYLWQSMYRRTLPYGRKGIGMTATSAVDLARMIPVRNRPDRLSLSACRVLLR